MTQPAARPQVRRLQLDAEEAQAVRQITAACARSFASPESVDFLQEVTVIGHELPRRIRREVDRARLDEALHALVVYGHEVDDGALGRTPAHWREAANEPSRKYGFTLMLYASLLGEAIAWETQQDGRLITDVLPVCGLEFSTISASSRLELGWHTEDAFSPYRADYVGLYCLRNPDDVATTIGSLSASALDEVSRCALLEPRFRFRPDPSHSQTRGDERGVLRPIVGGSWERPTLCIDKDYTRPDDGDDVARHAFARACHAIAQNLYEIILKPGDLCFMDNQNVVHGRRSFTARHDGRDRWLKRVNVTRDIRRSGHVREGMTRRVVKGP